MTHESGGPEKRSGSEKRSDPDLRERSQTSDGQTITLDRRLFFQLLAFSGHVETQDLIAALDEARLPGVLYEDVNDPHGVALLTFSEDPVFFVAHLRPFLRRSPFAALTFRPALTMLGRTYALGQERDLEEALLVRPRRRVCDPALPWAVWYPLRRTGAFEQLPASEQRVILAEHGGIGHAYGRAGYAVDIRLACFGLDQNDNDFVVGLLGPDLYPLSSIVQRMRKTQQTSRYIERMGPFFVGRAVWQREDASR